MRDTHLFELWWAEYMPEVSQARAWAAWTAALHAFDETEAAATMELLRKAFCRLQRYSFHLMNGGVRRVPERYGNWIEFDVGHQLFDAEVLAGLQAADQAERAVARAKGGA